MADLTEKERLWKEIKLLSDFLSQAKQKSMENMERSSCSKSKIPSAGSSGSQAIDKQQQQPGSSVITCTSHLPTSLPTHTCVPTTQVLAHTSVPSTSSSRQHTDSLTLLKAHWESAQQQAQPRSQTGNTSQDNRSGKKFSTSSACAEELGNQSEVIIRRRIVVGSDCKVPLCAGEGAACAGQNCKSGKGEAEKIETTLLTKHNLAKVVQKTSLSGVANMKHGTVGGQATKAPSSQPGGLQSEGLSGQKSSTTHLCPVQPLSVSGSTKSLEKVKMASKTAEVKAARETMLKKIEDMKSKLADIAAAKKKRKNAMDKTVGSRRQVCFTNTEPMLNTDTVENLQFHQVKESGEQKYVVSVMRVTDKATENVAECSSPEKCTKQEPSLKGARTEDSLESRQTVPCRTVSADQGSIEKKETVHLERSDNHSILFSSEAEPLQPVSIKMENVSPTRSVGVGQCSSPSRSVAKAKLEKELRATEEKLQTMRKKMGIMLKESPQESVSGERGSHQCLQDVSNVCGGVHSCSTPTSTSGSGRRPFLNRTSLKWTPRKFPRRKPSEHVLVIGSSPNKRSLAVSSVKATSSRQTVCSSGADITHACAGPKRPIQRCKASQYTLVRSKSTFVDNKLGNSLFHTSVSQLKKPDSPSGLFVSRYKVQRIKGGSKGNSCTVSLPKKTVVQSRYKLTKFVSKDSQHLPVGLAGLSTPLSAKQKAARIIKSKYKIRKVPHISPRSGGVTVQAYQQQHLELDPRHWRTPNTIYSPSTLNLKRNEQKQFLYNTSYQVTPSSLTLRANRGRGSVRQRRISPASFQAGSWTRGFLYDGSYTGWGSQTPQHLQLLSKRQRARTAKAWRMQWKMQCQWGQFPYDHMAHAIQEKAILRQRMMCLKRQHWKNTYYLSRKQAVGRDPGSRKNRNVFARRERLVMINGIVYKSSSCRLTRASSSADAGALASLALFRSTRGGRRQRMKTVMVRGVRFKVDARGTKLQRVANSAKKGKTAAVSGVDVGGMSIGLTRGALGKISDTQTRYVINRVKQRSIYLAAAKSRKTASKDTKKNCLYFSRFGKCSRGEACPFLHDPAKVAVCTRFLRGTCQVENCPFSHKVSKEKMPVCAFFLKGVCTRESCPYLHVKVNQGAEVCQDFISGFCPLAEKCQKLHTLTCVHFSRTGTCPEGRKCRLLHHKGRGARRQRARTSSTSTHTPTDSTKERKRRAPSGSRQDTQGEDKERAASAPKHARQDCRMHSATSRCHTLSPSVPHSSAASAEAETPASADRGMGTELVSEEQRGGNGPPSQQKLPKLPAFISLADYSFEESPVRPVKASSLQKTAVQSKGLALQIKPQL